MTSLRPSLQRLLQSLPLHPIEQQTFHDLVANTLLDTKDQGPLENKKIQWEYLLKDEVFALAATEGNSLKDGSTGYYERLRDRLDLILAFTEQDACEQTFPFLILQDLLETQTITSCSHIFSWLEARSKRLTKDMVPQKGKALILLRTLNDLLRRLSKMGANTIFCGRILTFLSGVFPLGERSGVNLRGEYGPTWEGVGEYEKGKSEVMKIDPKNTSEGADNDKMQVDEIKSEELKTAQKPADKTDDFYHTFWSLQLPFSKPPSFAVLGTFNQFRDAVNKVLPVIKEATAKERAMMGSRAGTSYAGSLKRKREPEVVEETNTNEYFFAKFLTNPDLLDLEIADTHFRRQFLFQLLILLNHLLTFTKAAKSTWSSPRNRSLQMDFELELQDAQWVQETINKAMEELRQTTPNGRPFADTVNVILEREKNWVKWKNELCAPFDKEAWSAEVEDKRVGLLEATTADREKLREEPKDWEWTLGSQPLTEIWEMGFRDLTDLQNPFQPGDVKDFVRKIKQESLRIEMRKKALARSAERLKAATLKASSQAATAPSSSEPESVVIPQPVPSSLHPSLPAKPGSSPPKPVPPSTRPATPSSQSAEPAATAPEPVTHDEQIPKFEENKQRWSWLALRTARDQYLQHFGKIGTGDIEVLAQEIEKEQQEREKASKTNEATGPTDTTVPVGEPSAASPMAATPEDTKHSEEAPKAVDAEGDVKMEDRS